MASAGKATYTLKVEFPKEKVQAVEDATARFRKAQIELEESSGALRSALWDMRDSLTVERTES